MKSLLTIMLISTQIASFSALKSCGQENKELQLEGVDMDKVYNQFQTKVYAEDPILLLINTYGASDTYIAVAQDIINEEPLKPEELAALGDEIDAMYGKPDGGRFEEYSLLKLAVEMVNIDAAKALLEAGADPMANNAIFLFYAANNVGDPYEQPNEENLWFSNAVVDLYLQYGGDPNFEFPYYKGSVMDGFEGNNNIWAVKKLLDAGANPWVINHRDEPFLLTIGQSEADLEAIAYSAELGWFKNGSDAQVQAVISKYFDFYKRARADGAYFDQFPYYQKKFASAMSAIFDNSDYQPTPEMLAIIEEANADGTK